MPEDVRGGRISLPVVADLSKFRETLVAGVKAATQGVEAVVGVTVDTKQLRRELQREVNQAARGVKAKVGVEVDAPRLAADLRRVTREASRGVKATIGTEVSATRLRGDLERAVRIAERGLRAQVGTSLNTTGLRAKLVSAVESASRNVSAKIDIKWNTANLRARLVAAVKTAQAGVYASVGVRVDNRGLRRQIREAAAQAAQGIRASIGLDLGRERRPGDSNLPAVPGQEDREFGDYDIRIGADSTEFRAHLAALREWAERPVVIPIWADPRPFATIVRALRTAAQRPVTIPVVGVNVGGGGRPGGGGGRGGGGGGGRSGVGLLDSGPLERYLFRLQQFFVVVGSFVGLASILEGLAASIISVAGALSAVVGGLYAIVSAAGPAIAALAVLPNLIAAAAQAGVTLFAAFSGIGNAVSAIREKATASASALADQVRLDEENARRIADARRNLARAEESAAERIADARRSLTDVIRRSAEAVQSARQNVRDVIESSAQRIVAAERNLVSAQQSSLRAQERLNDAREEARERLQDLSLELRRAALDEEGAAIGLERARERFNEVAANPFATELDRREATLQYQEALQRVDEVAERNDDLAREGGELRQKGIEGSDAVVEAKRAIVEATQAERDAERELARARIEGAEAVAEARREVGRAEADAQRNIADAQRNLARAQRDAQRTVADAQRNLADALRQAEEPASSVATAVNNVEEALRGLSPEARSFAYFIADEVIPALEDVRNEIAAELLPTVERNLRRLLTTLLPQITRELVRSAQIIGDWFSDLTDYLVSPEFSADFQIISDGNQRALQRFGDSLNNVFEALTNIAAVVAEPGGLLDRFTIWVESLTEGWKESSRFNRESGKMFDFFDRAGDVVAQWGRIFGNIIEGFGNIGSASVEAGQTLTDSFEDATAYFVQWTEDNSDRLQQWFNDLVPVVEEVGGLIVDIFRGLARLADDPETLDFVQRLRDEVGPAIRELVEALQDAGVQDKLIEFLVSLSEALATLAENGGFQAFFDTVIGFLDRITAWGETESGRRLIAFFTELLGRLGGWSLVLGPAILLGINFARMLAGIWAIGKFLVGVLFGKKGIVTGIAYLIKHGPTVARILMGGIGLAGLPGTVPVPPRAPSPQPMLPAGPTTAARGGAAAFGGIALAGAAAFTIDEITDNIGLAIDDWLESRGIDLNLGSFVNTVGDFVTNPLGFLFTQGSEEGGGIYGWFADQFSKVDLGGLIERLPETIGNIDLGELWDEITSGEFSIGEWWDDVTGGFNIGTWFSENISTPVSDFFGDLFGGVDIDFDLGQWWEDTFGGFDIGRWWDENVYQPISDFFTNLDIGGWIDENIVQPWNTFWDDPFYGAGLRIGEYGREIYDAFFVDLPMWFNQYITQPWNTFWEQTFPELWAAGMAAWDEFWNGLGLTLSTWWNEDVVGWWNTTVVPGWHDLWNGLGLAISTWWNEDVVGWWNNTVVPGWNDLWNGLGEAISRWWHESVVAEWNSISTDWNDFWNGLGETVSRFFRETLPNTVEDLRRWAEELPDRIRDWFSGIPQAVNQVTGEIGAAWSRLWRGVADAAIAPVNWVINSVWNRGIVRLWQGIIDGFGAGSPLPTIDPIPSFTNRGGSYESGRFRPPGSFAYGGVEPGYAPGQDTRLALVSPGEGFLVPEAVVGLGKAMGTSGRNAVNMLNAAFSSRVRSHLPGFAYGGVYGGSGSYTQKKQPSGFTLLGTLYNALSSAYNGATAAVNAGIGGLVRSAQNTVQTALRSGEKYIETVIEGVRAAIRPIVSSLTSAIKSTPFGRLVSGVATKMIDTVVARIPGLASGGTVLPSYGGTIVRLAEAGRAETVVDTGMMNELLAELTRMLREQDGRSVIVADGAIQQHIYNPAPETPSTSLSRQMRATVEFGLESLTER